MVIIVDQLDSQSHDFNGELGGRPMSSVRPGWEGGPIMKEWARYAQAEMGKMSCPFVCNVIIKPVLMLDTTEEGLPILPDPDVDGGMRASVLVQVVWSFLTTHYSEQFEK